MEKIKRILSLALVLVMVLSYVPAPAFAADGGYTVAGSFNGWNTAVNPMTDNGDGTYSLTMSLQPGNYEFKVTDGTWSNEWGLNGVNYPLHVSGRCNVTITFNSATGIISTSTTDMVKVYFVNTGNWSSVKAYAWSTINGTAEYLGGWPGTAMTPVSGNLYSIEIPAAICQNIIFNNGSSQTDDLIVPSDGKLVYTYSANSWSTCASSHNWSNGSCTVCGVSCTHSSHDDEGKCSVCFAEVGHGYDSTGLCSCGLQAEVLLNNSVYTTFSEARSAAEGSTIKLLTDVNATSFGGNGYTLDLNGHTLTASLHTPVMSSMIVEDSSSAKNGKIAGNVYVYNKLLLESGTIEGTVYLKSYSAADSGVDNKGAFTMTGGAIMAETDIYIYTDGAAVSLQGGSFPGGIKVEGTTLADCIPSGYAYFLDGNVVTLTEGQTEITDGDVTVAAYVAHTHTYTNGFCESVEGETHYEPAQLNADGVYEIFNAGQLYWFAAVVNSGYGDTAQNTAANALLTADITVNEGTVTETGTYRNWTPIGYFTDVNNYTNYTGTFDGNGKTVSGLYFNNSNVKNVGLIGGTHKGFSVRNVTVTNSYFYGGDNVGAIVGCTWEGTAVTGCSSSATVVGNWGAGGIVGGNHETPITDCHNTGSVSGSTEVGGITGFNTNGSVVSLCSNTGSVSGNSYVGGIVGKNSNGTVTNCYNTGSVKGNSHVGGIVGQNQKNVSNCYNTGAVTVGDEYAGGVVGNSDGTVTNCYYLTGTAVGGINGSDTAGSAEAMTADQFTSGEVAYLLNNQSSANTVVWKQTLDGTSYPTFSGGTVYYAVVDCVGGKDYSNSSTPQIRHDVTSVPQVEPTCQSEGKAAHWQCVDCGAIFSDENGTTEILDEAALSIPKAEHTFDGNGFCANKINGVVCDAYEPATPVTAENCGQLGLAASYEGYYAISNAGQLYWVADKVDNDNATYRSVNVVLVNDITVNSGTVTADGTGLRVWNPIGYYSEEYVSGTGVVTDDRAFGGIFDGNGKTVSGLYLNDTDTSDVGLICRLNAGGIIRNVTVTNSYLCSDEDVGGIVGVNYGTVSGCFNGAAIISNEGQNGGIAGYNQGTVELCGNTGTVTNFWLQTGGIVGYNKGIVRNCWNTGSIQAGDNFAGGIVGFHVKYTDDDTQQVLMENCWSTGNVSLVEGSQAKCGGIVGKIQGTAEIRNCYTTMSQQVGETNKQYGIPTVDKVETKTQDQFASGEVAYLLGGVWGQNIDNDGVNEGHPVFSDAKVYQNINCLQKASYSNTEDTNIHSQTHSQKVEPTCTDAGNVEYWYCSVCEKYFANEDCTTDLEETQLSIAATGHHYNANGVCDNVNNGVVCGDIAPASVTLGTNAPTYYATLQDALDAVKACTAEDQAVVTVRKDIVNTNGMAANAEGGVFTLDIGEFSITGSNFAIQLNNSTVTLTGTTGTVNNIYLLNSSLTMEGGNVACTDATTAIMVVNSTLAVSGGTVGSNAANTTAIYADNSDSITISGTAKIIGTNAIAVSGTGTEITMTGGTVESTNDFSASEGSAIQATISGGAFTEGITVSGKAGETLNDLLKDGCTYWQSGQQLDVEDGITTLSGTVEVKESCKHPNITYTTSGAKLISDCDTCTAAGEAELVPLTSEELVYSRGEKSVTATGSLVGYDELPEVTYEGDRKNVGSFTAYLTVGNVSAQLTQEIAPFLIDGVMAIRRVEKIYDGTTAGDFIVEKFFGPLAPARDEIYTLTAEFDSPDVGQRKLTVTLTLMDNDAAKNYDFGEPGGNSFSFVEDQEILPATVTVTGSAAQDKVYDGTTDAVIALGTVEGIVEGDDATVTATGVFADAASGTDKTATVTYAITGTDAGNYVLATTTEQFTASITLRTAEEITEDVKDLTEDTVTSDDADALEQTKQELETQLTDPSLTDEQKQQLQDALDKVEDLLDRIDDAVNAPNTDAVEDTMDVTAENVKPEDKEDIQQAIEDLEDALEKFGDNYTEDQKQTIEEAIERLEDALEALDRVQAVVDAIERLPETAAPDSEKAEDIYDVKDAYDALSDYEKSLISQKLTDKLNKLISELVDYKIIKGDGGVWTKGTTSDLSVTANGAYSKFTGIQIDGKTVDEKNYSAKSGSTIIELKAPFLETLAVGKHSITVCYSNDKATGTITVQEAPVPETTVPETTVPETTVPETTVPETTVPETTVPETTVPETTAPEAVSPSTGDDSNIFLWSMMILFSTAAAAALISMRKRFGTEE